MCYVAGMHCTWCHFDIFTMTWYKDEQTLQILSLVNWNLKSIFFIKILIIFMCFFKSESIESGLIGVQFKDQFQVLKL